MHFFNPQGLRGVYNHDNVPLHKVGSFLQSYQSDCLLEPNFGGMVIKWHPFRIVSDDPNLQPRCSFFNIGSHEKSIKKSSHEELLPQLEPNFGGMVLR